MNYYVHVINEAVDYIESNIGEKLSLSHLSEHFRISDFHFNRMFKTVSGITLKQYILGRKLTKSVEMLKKTNQPVIDIGLELGFEYPEVFSRAFKSQFGVSPTQVRYENLMLQGIPKVNITEREMINYKGGITLKGSSRYLDAFRLIGKSTQINMNSMDYQKKLKAHSNCFLTSTANTHSMSGDSFYTLVNCNGGDQGDYTVFIGKKTMTNEVDPCFHERIVPSGWYVCFQYYGDMFEIRDSFVDDLYKWIIVKEAEIELNGIGMMNIFSNNYPEDNGISILIPIKKPV